ncbi:MFS transporter [Erwinia mallotivora]|uniref:Major facilitator superfamily (MFS) profile domain-containing protein n=1 Tax=Erwinia mallotivora TaxID=69222 RepID=A0A014N3G6_9GAMM|nr:MFS transporter [Erwinia mallotivora]EXU73948.1 hypothetical protein BG55_20070 [Erwinia mallotivora]
MLFSAGSLNPTIKIMLTGTFLSRIGYFMVWPFLSLYLHNTLHVSLFMVGVIFFVASLSGVAVSIFFGYHSDRSGRNPVICFGLLISIISFILMGAVASLTACIVAICFLSAGRALIESSSKSLIGDMLSDAESKARVQYLRYYIINIGSALGPIPGLLAANHHRETIMYATAFIYFIYLLLMIFGADWRFKKERDLPEENFWQAFAFMLRHKKFTVFVLCNFIVMLIYAVFDTTLIQYINLSNPINPGEITAMVFIANAAGVILLQKPVMWLMRSSGITPRIVTGTFLLTLSQLAFLFSDTRSAWQMIFSTLLLTLGEIIVMPTLNIATDLLAPAGKRGITFGISNMAYLGTAVSPLLGGFLLQYAGVNALFFVLSALGFAVLLVQWVNGQQADYRQNA